MSATPAAEAASASQPFLELDTVGDATRITDALLRGRLVIIRRGLQQLGLLAALEETTFEGIRAAAGQDVAECVRRAGFDRIHDLVDSEAIPGITEAVYRAMTRTAPGFLKRFVPPMFGVTGGFYFEREPNVRFHVPYDYAAPRRQQYDQFARRRGQGKVTAHGPHRDSWLNCPDNAVNAWIAVGPVRSGNGLTFFPETYHTTLPHNSRGEITLDVHPGHPLNVELQPGDVLLFHGDHLHASELNRTDATRYVISFRLTFDKPHFPHGHFHHYLHSSLAGGPYHWLAEVPANLQWSYVAFRVGWLSRKAFSLISRSGPRHERESVLSVGTEQVPALDDLPVGTVRAVSRDACVARIHEDRIVAFSRRCPHQGADLAKGTVRDGVIMCPWHNLVFDPTTGASPCESLPGLRLFPCAVHGDRVVVGHRADPSLNAVTGSPSDRPSRLEHHRG